MCQVDDSESTTAQRSDNRVTTDAVIWPEHQLITTDWLVLSVLVVAYGKQVEPEDGRFQCVIAG